MRLVVTSLLVVVLIAVAACSETSGGEQGQSEASTTVSPTPRPPATPTTPPTQDEEYLSNAITFTRENTVAKGPFEVSIIRAGTFTITDSESGDKSYFRVDLKVENVGTDTEQFTPTASVLSDTDGTEYETRNDESEMTLGTGFDIGPGETQRGYWLFQSLPESATGIALVFDLGRDAAGSAHEFTYELEL